MIVGAALWDVKMRNFVSFHLQLSVMATLHYKKTHRHKNTKQSSNTIKAPSLQAADNNGHYVT
jgi:hypothetical protein